MVGGLLAIALAGHWGQFTTAVASQSPWVLAAAAALHLSTLLARSEAWTVCIRAAGGTVERRRVYRAASVGYLVNLVNGEIGFAARIAALRRSAPKETPGALALATTEVPIVAVEAALAALTSFTLVGPLGLAWWVPIIAFAAVASAAYGLRRLARTHDRGAWKGLAVMRGARCRATVVVLVVAAICAQIARNWLLLQASGVHASVFDATAVLIAVAVLGILPVGPSVGAGASVLILGAHGVAAVAAAGVLLTATGTAGALVFFGWALGDRLCTARGLTLPALRRARRTRFGDLADAPASP